MRLFSRWMYVIAVCGGLAAGPAYGQAAPAYTLVVRGVPLRQALEELGRLAHIDLVYTSDLVAGKRSYCSGRGVSAEALLGCVLAGSGLDYVRSSSGAYVLIEAVEERPRYGDLAGSVVDRETGEPLPFANVLLADASAGTTTNEAGLFSFSALVSGPHRLVVTYVGYETGVDTVFIVPGAHERVALALAPEDVALGPVVVDGLEQRLPSAALGLGERTQAEWMASFAAATPDVARAATTLLGVSSQQPLADLHIQGGAAGEHLTLLDGVPVRDPVSLGRHLSAFSPLAVGRFTVHKAGFGAALGSHLSGAVTVEHDVDGGAGRRVAASADPLSVNARVQGRLRLPGGGQGAAMVALRRSAWDVYRDPGLSTLLDHLGAVDPLLASSWLGAAVTRGSVAPSRYQPAVGFTDVHAAARLHLSPFRVLNASAYYARSHIGSELAGVHTGAGDARLFLTSDDYDWENWAGQVHHSWLLGARSIATVHVQGSLHASGYTYFGLQTPVSSVPTPEALAEAADSLRPSVRPSADEEHRVGDVTVKGVLEHSFSPRHHAEAGLAATHVGARLRLDNPFVIPLAHETDAWELSGYVEGRIGLGLRTTVEPGLRLTFIPARSAVYAEPRLSLRHDQAQSPVGAYALRVAAGLYRQFTNPFELTSSGLSAVIPAILFWLPLDGTMAPPRVYHLSAEALLMPWEGWTLGVEGYYKHQPRLLTLDYAALSTTYGPDDAHDAGDVPQAAFVSAAEGRAFGAGVRLHRAGPRLRTTLSYSFGQALRRFPSRFDGRLEPVPWEEPHRLLLDAEATLAGPLSAGLSWQGGWGRRWALRRAYYDYVALVSGPGPFGPFDVDDPSAQALPPYYRLDVGLTYRHEWGRAAVHVRAFVVNVLDRRNVYDRVIEQTGGAPHTLARTLPGRQPVLAVRFEY